MGIPGSRPVGFANQLPLERNPSTVSDRFTLISSPNHVEIVFADGVKAELGQIKVDAEKASAKNSLAFEAEVAFFTDLIAQLQNEVPVAMQAAGWPVALQSGDKLDDFLLMTIKELALDARKRGTNASAKEAVIRLGLR